MNPVGSEEFPTSTSIMPFLNMFKPKRSRSYTPSERFSDDSELYDQAPLYGPPPTLGSNHIAPIHRSQNYSGSRSQHQPRHRSALRRSSREQYAQPEEQDQVRHTYVTSIPLFTKQIRDRPSPGIGSSTRIFTTLHKTTTTRKMAIDIAMRMGRQLLCISSRSHPESIAPSPPSTGRERPALVVAFTSSLHHLRDPRCRP